MIGGLFGSANNDGTLNLSKKEDGFYLTITAPKSGGKKIEYSDIINIIEENGIQNHDFLAISQLINTKEKVFTVLISTNLTTMQVNERANINISSNKMTATVKFTPPKNGGGLISISDFMNMIEEKGIVSGVKKDYIDSFFYSKAYREEYVIAEGISPVNGEDAYLVFSFDKEKKPIQPKILENGAVDYRNLGLIEVVRKDQLLVTLIPATEGQLGKTVTGSDVSFTKGKAARLPGGKNVRYSPDGLQMFSNIDGQIQFTNNKINVLPVYEVSGNVDSSIGNINFLGNVVVRGSLMAGFSIVATGDVEVFGVVESATIECEGDIIIHNGIQGMGKGRIQAGGNIRAKFIENCSLRANKNITADAIMHSNIWCGGSLYLEGKKGLLVGGKIQVGEEVNAYIVGSHMATVTDLEVGIELASFEKYNLLNRELNNLKLELVKTDQLIEALMKLRQINKLDGDKKSMLIKSIRTKSFALEKAESLQHEIEELLPKLERGGGKVKVRGYLHPGVKVMIGNAVMYVKEELRFCMLYNSQGDIKIGAYS